MHTIEMRGANALDFPAIVALNTAAVQHTSAMELGRLRLLDELSAYHKVITVNGKVAAFLLAMRDGSKYRNDNYQWFSARYSSFVYIDRIVVATAFTGLKLGTLLYNDLFAYAHKQKIAIVVCEYNIVPPNDASRAFHDKFGFQEVGRQWLDDGAKQVSLQMAALASCD